MDTAAQVEEMARWIDRHIRPLALSEWGEVKQQLTTFAAQQRVAVWKEAANLLANEAYRLERNVPLQAWVPDLYAQEFRRRATGDGGLDG